MSGKIVICTNLDSVRIEVLGESRAVMIPAVLLLAADRVFRTCFLGGYELNVSVMDDDGEIPWEAWLDMDQEVTGRGASPWRAVADLADRIQGRW